MEQDDTDTIEMLLPRYCTGQVTDAERKRVKCWMNESEENRRMVQAHFILYLSSNPKKVSAEKALSKVKHRMQRHRMSAWLRYIERTTAILFIPVAAAAILWLYHQNDGKQISPQICEVKVSPGMTASLVLPDSTVVFLNSGSSLSYPTFFSGNTREVELNGEAYFQVTRNPRKKFIVFTPHRSRIEVLGTCFNVEAYKQDDNITTTLIDGKVNFLFNRNDSVKKVVLAPMQKLIYNAGSNEVKLHETTGLPETAWRENEIMFDNTPLEEILHELTKVYNVEFTVKSERLKKSRFTGRFRNQPLERALEYFKNSSKMHWRYIREGKRKDGRERIEIY